MMDVYGTFVMLEAVKKYKPKKFLHISTDEFMVMSLMSHVKKEIPFIRRVPMQQARRVRIALVYSYYKTYDYRLLLQDAAITMDNSSIPKSSSLYL